ncbi:flagellar brake protein [Virgibacillus sp. MSP4-1]|uniref:flagellar brake protein n=1 Tax=Virgibacillus sp. MSP4-1 TaxID=2700081 RepID=UPI0003A98CDB|nr:flagellar brake domain-containing protein [Virgibacillus sp. MSP4-1]QHS22604.1 flagellar brake protein [Virgibacillus sp. MSP4-1]
MKVGTVLSLSYIEEGGQSIQSYTSKIIDMDDEECLIQYPVNDDTGRTSFFIEGRSFNVQFVGKDEVVYSFPAQVMKRKKINSIPVLALSIPAEESFTSVQRRNYVRVLVALDVSVHPQRRDVPAFTTTTIDVSGGGLAIRTPDHIKLNKNDQLDIWVVLPFKNKEYQYVHAYAKVMRQIKKQSNIMVTSLMFDEISTDDREQMIRFCFQKQIDKKRITRNRHNSTRNRG